MVGAAQWGSLASEGHAYRDAHGIGEGEINDDCAAYIRDLRDDPAHRALRATHAGLLAAGEVLYVANAVTGMRMRTRTAGVSTGKLHRYAFYTHATLMLAEVGLGLATTSALSRGAHEEQLVLGGVHAAIGLTIPVLVLGSGIAIDHARR